MKVFIIQIESLAACPAMNMKQRFHTKLHGKESIFVRKGKSCKRTYFMLMRTIKHRKKNMFNTGVYSVYLQNVFNNSK